MHAVIYFAVEKETNNVYHRVIADFSSALTASFPFFKMNVLHFNIFLTGNVVFEIS